MTKRDRDEREAETTDKNEDVRSAAAKAAIGVQHKRSIRETWWPPIESEEDARKTARYGFWAAVINVLMTGFLAAILLMGGRNNPLGAEPNLLWWALGDAVVFVAVAAGLYVYSRLAAVAGLLLFVGSKVFGWILLSQAPQVGALLIAALFLIFYIHGVRGCFALARFRRVA